MSTIVNRGPLKAYVFRNYNFLPGVRPLYLGGCQHQLWQAIRATSAAPGYFQEFPLGDDLHQVSRRSEKECVGKSAMQSVTHISKISDMTDHHQSLVGETVESRSRCTHTRSKQTELLCLLDRWFCQEINLRVFSHSRRSLSQCPVLLIKCEHNHSALVDYLCLNLLEKVPIEMIYFCTGAQRMAFVHLWPISGTS